MPEEEGGSFTHLCHKYLLRAYYMADVVEGQSFIHWFFSPEYVCWAPYNVAEGNGDLVLHSFPKFLLNAYYVLGVMEGWLFLYSFTQQIFIECLPKARGDEHLSFIHLFSIYYVPGTVLGPKDTAAKENKRNKIPALVKLIFSCCNFQSFLTATYNRKFILHWDPVHAFIFPYTWNRSLTYPYYVPYTVVVFCPVLVSVTIRILISTHWICRSQLLNFSCPLELPGGFKKKKNPNHQAPPQTNWIRISGGWNLGFRTL